MSRNRPEEAFRAFTTSTAFSISLSKNMIRALDCVDNRLLVAGVSFDWWTTSVRSLERRGLVESVNNRHTGTMKYPWKITRPGKLMLELCKIAGLVESPEVYARWTFQHDKSAA